MDDKQMRIDIEALRNDLKEEILAAYFAGGFGAALIEASDIERMSPEKLVRYAQKQRYDLNDYADEEED